MRKVNFKEVKRIGGMFLLWAAAILLWETVVQSAVLGSPGRLWPAAGFCLAAAALGTIACGLPGRIGRLLGPGLLLLAYVYYGTQLVYADVFGSYLSLAYAAVGGEAVATFWNIVLAAICTACPAFF